MTDAEIISNIRMGRIDDYALLIERHQSELMSVLIYYYPGREDLRRLMHDSFVHAYQKLEQFDPCKPFFPWLKQLSLNLVRDHIRSNSAHSERLRLYLEGQLEHDQRNMDKELKFTALNLCFQILPQELRELMDLHYHQKIPLKSLAESLNRSVGSIKMQLKRIRENLRKCMHGKLGSQNHG